MANPEVEEEEQDEDIDNFLDEPTVKTDLIEEYDGLNDNFAYFVIIARLEMLMRGHAIRIVTQDRRINIDVPNLYTLTINLPLGFDKASAKALFDCKKRTLAVILPLEGLNVIEETPKLVEEVKPVQENIKVNEVTESLTSDEMLFELA